MKIRYGFVSNSSSSSFIISNAGYPTVFSLALDMLAIRNEDWETKTKHKEEQKINLAIAKNLNNNIAVTFHTCNYHTYIISRNDRYLVSTCNNTDWGNLHHSIIETGGGHDEGDFRDEESTTLFWHLGEGLLGSPLSNRETQTLIDQGILKGHWCDKGGHFDTWVRLPDNTLICPTCWHINNPRHDMYLDPKKIIKPTFIPFRGVKLR